MKTAKDINVLIACEESQAVCKAFRELGFNAFSNDIQECSGGYPEWHLQMDCFEAIALKDWDLIIAFPPCTDLSAICASVWKIKQQDGRQQKAINFVKDIYNSKVKYICIENPTGALNTFWQKPTQIINPYQFGDPYLKRTCLWLKNLPILEHKNNLFFDKENITKPIYSWVYNSSNSKLPGLYKNPKIRSKTFPGIAKAMAEQWGEYILNDINNII